MQQDLNEYQHSHVFGQDQKRPGETRTALVIALTATMMVVEIAAGIAYGSMALLADGLHMASHAAALMLAVVAYQFTRRRAHDETFSFGTGKVNALGGYTSAVLLAIFALMMVWESTERLIFPVEIAFNQAILVAVVGLMVNGVSALVLQHGGHDQHHDHHSHPHGHHHHHDHNLRAAYLHVLADALTSLLAIFALLTAKYVGAVWLDPVMGIVGAFLVARWSWGLVRASSAVLLDKQAPQHVRDGITSSIEGESVRITDLHVWSIGPAIYAAEIAVIAHDPQETAYYKSLLPKGLGLVHVTVEVHSYGRIAAPQEEETASLSPH